jgi:histidine triad (HIT) family protein
MGGLWASPIAFGLLLSAAVFSVIHYAVQIALCIARRPVFRGLISWILANMSFAIPLERLHETATLIAFHHPQPGYPLHVLLVPKRARQSLADLTASDADFLIDLFQTVQLLVERFNLEPAGYRLIANGGRYQDVPHLHFHLISDLANETGFEE